MYCIFYHKVAAECQNYVNMLHVEKVSFFTLAMYLVAATADGNGDVRDDGAVVPVTEGSSQLLHEYLTVVERLQDRPPYHHWNEVPSTLEEEQEQES